MARPPHHSLDPVAAARDRAYACGALAFVALAIWGSWFPFVIQPISAERAAVMLRWSIAPAQFSLSDALSNLLLFVPIGVCIAPVIGRGAGLLPFVVTIAAGVALSFVLEIGQLLVPHRIPSAIDIVAETCGLITGAAIWRIAACEFDALLEGAIGAWQRATLFERGLWLYTAAFAVWWLLPFDFTLRPDEIADKFFHERLLLPWMRSIEQASATSLRLAMAAAMPIGWAAVLVTIDGRYRRSALIAATDAAGFLLILTILQATVFSRTTDTRMMLYAVVGTTLGAVIAARTTRRPSRARSTRLLLTTLLAVSWIAAVLAVEWWPLQFDFDVDRAYAQFAAWSFDPFRAPVSPFAVIPGALLAIAAAVLTVRHRHPEFARLQTLAALAVSSATFAVAEAVGLLITGREPTLTAVVIKVSAFAVTTAVVSGGRAALPSPLLS
jgi:glycopeptide antibiotics resistance protein